MLKEVKRQSCVPIYGFGIAFLLYCLLFPMYTALHLILCIGFSFAVYGILRKVFPPCVVTVKQKEKPKTEDPVLNSAMEQGRSYLLDLRRLNDEIPEQAFSDELDEIERITGAIFDQVTSSPDKLPKIRTLLNYFLPTTVKLISQYAALQSQRGIDNVDQICIRIRQSVSQVKEALRKQLNNLYENDVIDVTAEIQVMEQLLINHGLADDTKQRSNNNG